VKEENRRQIEEDVDRELLNMRIRHELIVREQKVRKTSAQQDSSTYLPKRSKCKAQFTGVNDISRTAQG